MKKWMPLATLSVLIFSCGSNNNEEARKDAAKDEAVKQLTEQVKLHPDSASLRMQLINSLDSLRNYDDAIAQTDSLIKRDSLNNGLWFTRAQLQEDNKDTAGAIKSYERAIRIYPSIDAQLSLANLFAESRNKNALAVCNNVLQLGLGREIDANCHFIAGVYFARTGDDKQALQLFEKAIVENYTLMEAYMEKGFVYYETKNYQEALKTFKTAITVNNTYTDAYYWQAKCHEALGNKDEAITNYKRSLGLDKKLKEAAKAIERLED